SRHCKKAAQTWCRRFEWRAASCEQVDSRSPSPIIALNHLPMKLTAVLVSMLSHFDAPPVQPIPALPPVILVHGFHSTADDCARLARFLRANGREVFTPTLIPNRGEA